MAGRGSPLRSLSEVVSEELLESSLERQRADLAENFAKIEESKKEAAEKELETMTQAGAREMGWRRPRARALPVCFFCREPGVGAAAQRGQDFLEGQRVSVFPFQVSWGVLIERWRRRRRSGWRSPQAGKRKRASWSLALSHGRALAQLQRS